MCVFHHPDRDFDSRGQAEPAEDVFNVAFDRVRRNNQAFGNLTVGQSAGNQRRDFVLAGRERLVRSGRWLLDGRSLQHRKGLQRRLVQRECLAN